MVRPVLPHFIAFSVYPVFIFFSHSHHLIICFQSVHFRFSGPTLCSAWLEIKVGMCLIRTSHYFITDSHERVQLFLVQSILPFDTRYSCSGGRGFQSLGFDPTSEYFITPVSFKNITERLYLLTNSFKKVGTFLHSCQL